MPSYPAWKRFSLASIAFVVLLFNVLAIVTCAPLAIAAELLVKAKLNVRRCSSLASTIVTLLTLVACVNADTTNCTWFVPHGEIPPEAKADGLLCDLTDRSNGKVTANITDKSCEIGLQLQTGSELRFEIKPVLGEQNSYNCDLYRNLFTMSVSKGCNIQFWLVRTNVYQLQASGPQSKGILKDNFTDTVSVTLSNGVLNAGDTQSVSSGCSIGYCGPNTVRVTLRGGDMIQHCAVALSFNQATFVLDGKYQPTTTTTMNTTAVTGANSSRIQPDHQSAQTRLTSDTWLVIYICSGVIGFFILLCLCCCVVICISSSRSKKRRAAQTAATKSVQQSTNTSPEQLPTKPPTGPKKSSASKESQTAEKDHSDMVTERIFTVPSKPPLSSHGALDRSAKSTDRADQQKQLESPKPRKILLPGEKRMQPTADYNTMNDVQSDWITEDKAAGAPNKKQATAEIKKQKATQTTQKFTETTQKSGENEDAGSPPRAARSPDDGSAPRRGSGSRRNDEALRTRSTVLDTQGPTRDRTTQQTREQTGERTTQATVNKSQH